MSRGENSRRKFLADAAKSLGLLGMSPALASMVVQSISAQANADIVGSITGTDRIYLFFALPGGPPRWYFDLPLTPNGTKTTYTDHFNHSGIGTYVGVSGGKPQLVYKPWYDQQSSRWLPPVWASNPAGGTFSNCLSNAAFIRGLDLEINNHSLGRMRNQSPIIGGLSLAGVLAQKTGNPFPAVAVGSIKEAFKAEKPLSPIDLDLKVSDTSNPIISLMNYFSKDQAQNTLVRKQTFAAFDAYAEQNKFSRRGLAEAKSRGEDLLALGVRTFTDRWTAVYAKYLNLISTAVSSANTSAFLDTKAIPNPAPGTNPDVRTQYADSKYLAQMSDIRKIVNSGSSVSNLASTFAAIEILVTTGLTQVATADIGALINMSINDSGGKADLVNDQHFVGSVVSTIATTFYYRTILTCTEELVLTLKSAGLFDKTVIHFGAEFNRNAKASGAGSDHGFLGGSALLISGMIKNTLVVGNTKNDTASTYAGTWGLADLHPLTGHEYPLRLNDVSRTVSAMLNIRHVANNGVFLFEKSGEVWQARSNGEAKNAA